MNQGKVYSVGLLGIPEQEAHLIEGLMKLTVDRPQGCYVLYKGADLAKCDIVLINADDSEVMFAWYNNFSGQSTPLPVLVTSTAMVLSTEQFILRPFGHAKFIMLLDRVVGEMQERDN